MENKDNYIIYLIINNINKKTYVGITNHPERRIKQHNGYLSGGAKYTTMNKGTGEWIYYGFILGVEKRMALSLEKKIHIHSRKTKGKTALERRINCIQDLLKDYSNLSFIIL
jgi:predicted GIY-YIG superfamily endonuclease